MLFFLRKARLVPVMDVQEGLFELLLLGAGLVLVAVVLGWL